MAFEYWWWLLALALGILELTTGTIYLLLVAAGCLAGGLAAWAGLPLWEQFLIAALIAAGGAVWLRRRRASAGAAPPSGRNPDVVADVGARVRVEAWGADRLARVQYRGTQWTVELLSGEAPEPGEFTVREVSGNRLIVGRR